MKMRDSFIDVYKTFTNDETLLRLLYYKPLNALDDPLDVAKPNILTMDDDSKWAIINDVIKVTDTVSDLDTSVKCRLLIYPGRRWKTSNYLFADQEVVVDAFAHFDFEEKDFRVEWLCDRVNELLCQNRVKNGIGKTLFNSVSPIKAPSNYVGYKLTYVFGSGN